MKPGALLLAALLVALSACGSTGSAPRGLPFQLEVHFEGQRSYSEDELREQVQTEFRRLEVGAPSAAALDDAAFSLELFYQSKGFPFAHVDYAFEQEDGRAQGHFKIDEGPRTQLRHILVEGTHFLSPGRAASYLGSLHSIYVARRIDAGLAELRKAYLEAGYLDVRLSSPETTFDSARQQATVRVRVQEGACYHLQELSVEGGLPELAGVEQDLRRRFVSPKTPYGPYVDFQVRNALLEAYGRHGHPDVTVKVDRDSDTKTGVVRLAAQVEPGPRVRISEVQVTGNPRTRPQAIRDTLRIHKGDLYDSAALRAGFRDLYATGLFETVELDLQGEGEERALVVTVSELRSVQVRIEPGWGSYEGPRLLLGVDENNFRGAIQRLSLEGTVSPRSQSLNLGLHDPSFLGSRFSSETSFFIEHRQEPSFEFSRIGARLFLRRRWSERWSSSFGYEFLPTNVIDNSLQAIPPDLNEDTNVAELSASLIWNTRDNLLLPTRGSLASFKLEWAEDALGSQVEFLRALVDLTHLFRLGEDDVLAALARTGLIAPFGITDQIPLPERFFNGGDSSVRSFREDELGPTDLDGDPVGGEGATTLSLEWRHLLTGNLAGALFVDAGNVTRDITDYLDFPDFRYGVGAGIRYLLPVGPLRLDFAVNPDPRDGEDEYVLHFSVGFPF